jgi:hypothetical protein
MVRQYILEQRHARSATDARRTTGENVADFIHTGSPFINVRRNRPEAKADGSGLCGMGRRLLLAAPAAISAATLMACRARLPLLVRQSSGSAFAAGAVPSARQPDARGTSSGHVALIPARERRGRTSVSIANQRDSQRVGSWSRTRLQ